MVMRAADYAGAFGERGPRWIAQSHPNHEQADAVVCGVTQEIERVGL